MNAELVELERQLKARQERELAAKNAPRSKPDDDAGPSGMDFGM